MSLEQAVRLIEILLGWAFVQHSIEHFKAVRSEQIIYIPRVFLAVLLISGWQHAWISGILMLTALASLHRFQGPYIGGADRMGLLILSCLCLYHMAPTDYWREVAIGYLALQLTLSYVISGWVKIKNPAWRSGLALRDVFQFSAYPVSESLRQLAQSPRLLLIASWWVMSFELMFPLALASHTSLTIMLIITATFHLANACVFGLNRFFWTWIAAYPAIGWFQGRVVG